MSVDNDPKNHPDYPLNLPYADRQLIRLEPEANRAGSATPSHAVPEKTGFDWGRAAVAAMQLAPIVSPVLAVASGVIVDTINSNRESLQVLSIPVNCVSKLKFPVGHPRNRFVYAGNPTDPPIYYPLAQFHRMTFEHKFSEIISLLLALGATTLEVEHEVGWSREFATKVSVPLPDTPISISGGGGQEQKARSALLFKAELEGRVTPHLPANLVWYRHESTWQQIAEARLSYGLKEFSLKVSYEDDLGINGELQALVKKAGLNCGGKFQAHRATIWRIQGKF